MIKILGAGISGLTAAINLAKAGYEVEVFELEKDCGCRFKGDLQGLENWSSKKDVLKDLKLMNVKLDFDYTPFKKIFLSDGNGKTELIFKKPLFYLVKRGIMKDTLDQGLKKQAIELGVKIYFNSRKDEKDVHIIASGPKPKEVLAIDKGIAFETDMDDVAIGLINNKTTYKGYSYLLVTNGYGCMCTIVFGKTHLANKCFKETKILFSKLIDLKIKNQREVGGYGNFSYKPNLIRGGRLYIGEAAGLQDALFGFGMRFAITSGYFSARSIIDNINYKKLIEERFSNQLKASIVNRFLWEKLGDRSYQIFINKIKKIKDPFKLLFKIYNFSFDIQKLLFPIAVLTLKKKYKT